MMKTKSNSESPRAFTLLDEGFASELRAFGISREVIRALRTAMIHMTKGMDKLGFEYSRYMRQTLIEYGLSGVKDQTFCMLKRMIAWRGVEARKCKLILRKWCK